MNNNKPEDVADPVETEGTSEAEAIRERISEGIQQQKTGGVMNPITEPEVAKPSGGTADVATQEISSDGVDANTVALKLIETSTGRKFEKLEDAQKFLTNLNSLVGDQNIAKAREAEKILTNLTQKFGKTDIKELETYLTDLVLNPPQKPQETKPEVAPKKEPSDPELEKRLEKLEHDNQLLSLERKYPNAHEVAEEVALIAKAKGISYIEAYETSPLKDLIELKAKEATTKNPIVTPSNKTKFDTKKVEELGKRVVSGKSSLEEQQALVSEVLGL